METLLPTHPESNFRLIQRSLMLYGASFTQVFWFALLLAFITFIPRFVSDALGRELFANVEAFSLHRLWILLLDIIGLMVFIVILWRMHCIERGYHEPLVEDFTVAVKKVLSVLLAVIIQVAILFAIVILFFALTALLQEYHLFFTRNPWGLALTAVIFIAQFFLILYVSALFIFFIPLIAIENKGVFQALERSVMLAWNHWWRILLLQFFPWITYLFLLLFCHFLLEIDVSIYFMRNTTHSLWVTLFQLILFTLFIIWASALLLVQLRDLELRRSLTHPDKYAG